MTGHSVATRPSGRFLDNLLERLPAGLPQLIGETGWRLSHGERSRLFMARAL
jgi:ATP-binding cassette, subfamily B, bacterial